MFARHAATRPCSEPVQAMPSESARWRCSRVALRKAAISAAKDGDGGAPSLRSPPRGQLGGRHLALRVRETRRYKAVLRAGASEAVRVGAVTMFACRSPRKQAFRPRRTGLGGGALSLISPPRGQLRERHSACRLRETCRYEALFRAGASDAGPVGAVTIFACRSPRKPHIPIPN